MSEDWLAQYKEAKPNGGISGKAPKQETAKPLIAFRLPRPKGMNQQIEERRNSLVAYNKNRDGLIDLFRRCANQEITSSDFYEQLPNYWGYDRKDRLTGEGWQILGKQSDFEMLSQSYMNILEAADEDRDDMVADEIDNLENNNVPTRGAFLSEMLCLEFPQEYPVLNKPIKEYLKKVNFKAPRGASEGVRYVDLAKKLRLSLIQNPTHPAHNLAELDAVIWLAFGN